MLFIRSVVLSHTQLGLQLGGDLGSGRPSTTYVVRE